MTHTKQINSSWLISDVSRAQASVKYDIKHLEGMLTHYLSESHDLSSGINKLISTCESLSLRYADYLQIIEVEQQNNLLNEFAYLHCRTWRACYHHIQLLKQQLVDPISSQEAGQRLGMLSRQYQHLGSLLALSAIEPEQKQEKTTLLPALKPLLIAKSPAAWLNAVVHFANLVEPAITEHLSHVSRLAEQQLLHLSQVFNQQDHVHLMSAIFYYKLHPQKLFNAELHPEKLVSVKTRLSLLYDFVEMFHQSLVQALAQKDLHLMHDYLFHGEELPQGIEIAMREDYRTPIQSAVKLWRVKVVPINEDSLNLYQLEDMGRAYKFWFNSDRLIDAAMRLEQRIISHRLPAHTIFYQQMLSLYHQLTTTECLDLYGYFSNKDSSYLMRTLLVVKQGAVFSWLPPLSPTEQHAIQHVYDTLESVMNALRDELTERQITTAPYKRKLPANAITPGRRNRNAVIRIVTLYSMESPERNNKLEQLFDAL